MPPSGIGSRFIVNPFLHQTVILATPASQGSALNRGRFFGRFAMARKLFIGGLAFSTSNDRLREVFAEAGQVESAAVVTDRDTGQSRGFGFVEMSSAEEANEAVKKFNGHQVDGRTIRVELANSAGAGGSRGGYKSGGGARSRGGRW